MIWIPPGEFTMGTDQKDEEGRGEGFGIIKPWFEDENPAHTVHVDGFYIDRHEVSQGAYTQYIKSVQAPPPIAWAKNGFPQGPALDYPVTEVNWSQADTYCRWAGKRLPTEAEWEKAARGPEGLIYPWGNEFSLEMANLMGEGPAEVGSFPQGRSPYGVEDMIGNAWEWTHDRYNHYPGSSLRSDLFGNNHKVVRGKSWISGSGHQSSDEKLEITAHTARSGYRLNLDPLFVFNDLGFRCAKSL